ADPAAKLSPPKQPIVFWLENTIPVQYREWFKEGVLLWNKAFERIGFKDAIEVKQQPDDANWEAADTRYSTIRWFGGVDATFGVAVLEARGELTPEVQERVMREWIIEVTAHEVGHTLGLRHNFRASTILKVDELNDLQKTDTIGQTGSVMDYNPIFIASKGERQGHFLTPTLGPYDYWAIEYAYKPIQGDEKAELSKIASRAADPMVAYSTDEDA